MKNNKRILTTYIVFVVGVICIIMGVSRGEAREILNKGVNVCLECIGIG